MQKMPPLLLDRELGESAGSDPLQNEIDSGKSPVAGSDGMSRSTGLGSIGARIVVVDFCPLPKVRLTRFRNILTRFKAGLCIFT